MMEPECSLPCLQDPNNFTYPEPGESTARPPNLFLQDRLSYYPPM